MKRFFTILALTSAFVPAMHNMDTSLPITSPNLINYIKNTDAEAFANEFLEQIAFSQSAIKPYITPATLAELEQCATETKKVLQQELLEAMSLGNNIDWKKLIGGSLICLPSGVCTLFSLAIAIESITLKNERYYGLRIDPTAAFALAGWLSSKIFKYGAHVLNNGWNYQQHLREQLKNLDIIIAQIKQAKV